MIERTVTPEPTPSTNAGPCLACGRPLPETQLDYFDTRFGQSSFYGIATCTACGLEQTVPRPGADELTNLYQTYYNFTGDTPASYTATRQRFFSSRGYAVWLLLDGDIAFHSRRGKGRLLEIGCNEGRNLWFYHKH